MCYWTRFEYFTLFTQLCEKYLHLNTGRLGPQNGVTAELPTDMPEAYFNAKQDQLNHSLFFEDPDAVDKDEVSSLPSSNTFYQSFKGKYSIISIKHTVLLTVLFWKNEKVSIKRTVYLKKNLKNEIVYCFY